MKHDFGWHFLFVFIKCSFALNAKCVDDVCTSLNYVFWPALFRSERILSFLSNRIRHMKFGWMKTCSCLRHGMDGLPANSFKHHHHIAAAQSCYISLIARRQRKKHHFKLKMDTFKMLFKWHLTYASLSLFRNRLGGSFFIY